MDEIPGSIPGESSILFIFLFFFFYLKPSLGKPNARKGAGDLQRSVLMLDIRMNTVQLDRGLRDEASIPRAA